MANAISRKSFVAAALLQLACSAQADSIDASGGAPLEEASGAVQNAPGSLISAPSCSTNQQCIEAHAGAPYRCRSSDQQCVPLLSQDCPRYLADEADLESDAAIYIGLLVVDDRNGAQGEEAVEMARSEIQLATGGGVPTSPGSVPHPLVIISCNTDGGDPSGAARHLVQEVQVSALLGGFRSDNVLSVAQEYTIPSGVLQIAPSATADPISALDDHDLVYRAQIPGDILFQVLTPFIDSVIQPAIYADGIAAAGEPIRVMVAYEPDGSGVYQAATIAKYLSVNGQPVLRNGSATYRELRLDNPDLLNPQPKAMIAAASVIHFLPHLIVYQTQDAAILRAVENAWPAAVPRPYLITSAGFAAQLPALVGSDGALRRRAFSFLGLPEGFDPRSFDAWAAQLASRAPERTGAARDIGRVYGPNLYDSLYMLSYAISTLGELEPTGLNLVSGFRRLGGPGMTIPFGPTAMGSALAELAAGRSIDYAGVSGVFRYTPEGDRSGLASIACVAIDDTGTAVGTQPSGFVYDTHTKRIVSATIDCP